VSEDGVGGGADFVDLGAAERGVAFGLGWVELDLVVFLGGGELYEDDYGEQISSYRGARRVLLFVHKLLLIFISCAFPTRRLSTIALRSGASGR
jgi:hypothetical protein